MLENEWLSFEQMIAPGGNTDPVKSSDFLVDGIVAYPSMKGQQNTTGTGGGLALEEQSSASSDSEAGILNFKLHKIDWTFKTTSIVERPVFVIVQFSS